MSAATSTPHAQSILALGSSAEVELFQELQQRLLMDRTVDLLIQKAISKEYWPETYGRASRVLARVVPDVSQQEKAATRLKNASAYAGAGEFGAAAFELRLLRTILV